jgi:hypothetical protein
MTPKTDFPFADIGAAAAKAKFVRGPTMQPTKMLRHARMTAMTSRAAVFGMVAGCPLGAVSEDGPVR